MNNFRINDLVSVIDENLSGKVTSVKGKTVCFSDEFGFIHEAPAEKLVLKTDIYSDSKIVKKQETAKKTSKRHSKNHLVLDLHFEKLVPNPSDYESFERLLIQKEKLLVTLDFCRQNHLKKLEIIHGVGDGVLQNLVYDTLESQTGLEFHGREILHHQSGSVMVFLV